MSASKKAGRAVIVTGGSRGLGANIVGAFLEAGDRVATCSRSTSADTERWSSDPSLGDRFYHEALDLSDRAATDGFFDHVVERFGGLDVLVNNAGIAAEGVLGLVPDEANDAVIDLNLKATLHMTKIASRRMLRQGSGRVINITSIAGQSAHRGLAAYSATKAGLDGLTRALSRELGPRGITVNSVAPGNLRTDMSSDMTEDQLGQIARRTPLGRLPEPDDVSAAVLFFASPEAGFITGQVLVVDGGLSA